MNTSLHLDPKPLIDAAREAYQHAYAPYSKYHVGAAVLCDDGRIFSGCNVENAVYPLCICAERVAIATAVAAGARHIVALAVVTSNGGTPCGSCRQVMREFGDPDMPVFIADAADNTHTHILSELLPDSFSATDLDAAKARGANQESGITNQES
ncbi:MAG: cytidine deaminase [Anaerolineae bacterium]|nr:cytidine deaminase [Anaerolineae bacterium]